jgi:hypothetical protein
MCFFFFKLPKGDKSFEPTIGLLGNQVSKLEVFT